MDNYKPTENRGTRIQSLICDKINALELSEELTLSDYQPEIKRLLRAYATVSPADKYIGGGNATFSGNIDYHILYAAPDGAFYSATQSGEYEFACPVEMPNDFEYGDGVTCDVEILPETTVCRVTSPRRMALKCRLRTRVRLFGTRVLDEEMKGMQEEAPQRLMGTCESAKCFVGMSDTITLGDEILYDAEGGALRVISAVPEVYITEASAGSGVVNCRGEVAMKLLTVRDQTNDVPTLQWRKIPFSGSIPTDGAEVNCTCTAKGVPTDCTVTVEDGRLLCEIGVRLESRAYRNESVSYTKDLYSTEREGQMQYEHVTLPYFIKANMGNFSLNTMLSMEEAGVRPDQTIIDLSLAPGVTGFSEEHGKYICVGKCRCTALLLGDGEYGVQEFEIPWRYECEGSREPFSDYNIDLTPISARARMDGERIAIDAELAVGLSTHGVRQVQMLRSAEFGEEFSKGTAAYTICYPSFDDTLWSVAKRYHRSISDLVAINPISGAHVADGADSLSDINYLLI